MTFLFLLLSFGNKRLIPNNRHTKIPPAQVKDAEHNFLGAAVFNPLLGSEKRLVGVAVWELTFKIGLLR